MSYEKFFDQSFTNKAVPANSGTLSETMDWGSTDKSVVDANCGLRRTGRVGTRQNREYQTTVAGKRDV